MKSTKWPGIFLALAMLLQLCCVPALAEAAEEAPAQGLVAAFLDPDVGARPMFRTWMLVTSAYSGAWMLPCTVRYVTFSHDSVTMPGIMFPQN